MKEERLADASRSSFALFLLCAGRNRSILGFQLRQARCADPSALKKEDLVCIVTEDTSGLVFLQDNTITINEHFERILGVQFHARAKLLRDQNTAKLIDLFYESGRFHKITSF